MMAAPSNAPRLLVRALLEPLAGSIFQPAGFPGLGAAEFERPTRNGTVSALLVESVQSMANHLEALGWDEQANEPVALLSSLPYIRVESADDGSFLTSSRTEPQRLASAYIKDAEIENTKGIDWIAERLGIGERRPLDWARVYPAVFEMDPMCLIHGVFFADPNWKDCGNPGVPRAVTAAIEAHNVRRVVSGGLKRDDVQHARGEGARTKGGYGFVPYSRTEYTAEHIELTVVVDLAQLRGYGLADKETRLLELIALWETAALLDRPLRLRTACDLEVTEAEVARPDGYALPAHDKLAIAIGEASVELGLPGAWVARWPFKQESAKT